MLRLRCGIAVDLPRKITGCNPAGLTSVIERLPNNEDALLKEIVYSPLPAQSTANEYKLRATATERVWFSRSNRITMFLEELEESYGRQKVMTMIIFQQHLVWSSLRQIR